MSDLKWRKSNFSAEGEACVEVGWRKSSFSANQATCVEVCWPDGVAVRDSKAAGGPVLDFPAVGWRKFLATLPR